MTTLIGTDTLGFSPSLLQKQKAVASVLSDGPGYAAVRIWRRHLPGSVSGRPIIRPTTPTRTRTPKRMAYGVAGG